MKSVVVGTAGHIDHGKSALVRALTGTDPDRLKEEKARGITIDLGFAHLFADGIQLAFVDVPGHERFVKNMLAGVGGIDLVVLVVAANESVMPQTREHFEICRLLQVTDGVVALTKRDIAPAYAVDVAALEIQQLVAGSFLEGAPIIPVSSTTGEGLDALRTALVDRARRVPGRSADGAARLPVDRVFTMKGFGTVVTGTLVSGRILVDDELAILPAGRSSGHVKVRGIQVHGMRQEVAVAGQRTAVNVSGVEVEDLGRGQVLATRGSVVESHQAEMSVEVLSGARPLKHGARVRFHQGAMEVLGRVRIVGTADEIAPGGRGYIRLRFETPAVLTRGDRYIIRRYSPPVTAGGGVIVDPDPPRGSVRTDAALARASSLGFASGEAAGGSRLSAAARMIEEAAVAGFPATALIARVGVSPGDRESSISQLVQNGAAIRTGDLLVAPAVVESLEREIHATLEELHTREPLAPGLPADELRVRLFRRGSPKIFAYALGELAAAGRIAVRDRVSLATHQLTLSSEETRARSAIELAYRSAGLRPPEQAAVLAESGVSPAAADRMLKLLQRQKVLVKIDTLIFHDEALTKLKADVVAMKASGGNDARLDVATFKERFGVTRKFAIPLLEYLDRERVTRRVGDARVVL